MQKIRLRRISIDSIIVTIAACIIMFYPTDRIIKRFDRPFSLLKMRAYSLLLLGVWFFYSCKGIWETFTFTAKLIETQELKISDFFWLMPLWFIIVVTIMFWKKYWFFLRNDKGTILSSWYVNKSQKLRKEEEREESYDCLQKASQLTPDSVYVWSLLALFNEMLLGNPTQADEYLAKARNILNSNSSDNPKDTAIAECFSGFIMRYRDDYPAALKHMKKAYELDPTKYRKGEYEKALQMAEEQNGDDAEL